MAPNQNTVRSFESSIDIDAPVATVWEIVGEVENAPKWAPTTKKVSAFGGRTKNGTLSVNLNKQGIVYWPTTGKVVDYVPGKRIANKATSGVAWVFELAEGPSGPGSTTLTEYRETPPRVEKFFSIVVSKLTGGEDTFSEGLGKSVSSSLKAIKRIAEQRTAPAA